MKLKTIFTILFIILIIFLIYIFNLDTKIYYMNISDIVFDDVESYSNLFYLKLKENGKLEKYIEDFSNQDYRITDLIRDIENNKVISINDKDQTIQNALIKADIVTIKMGDNELNYKIDTSEINELFEYSDTLIRDLENLFQLIRKYCKEKIYFIGFYNIHSDYYDEIYHYMNLKIQDISKDYDIDFIEPLDLSKEENNVKIYKKIYRYLG